MLLYETGWFQRGHSVLLEALKRLVSKRLRKKKKMYTCFFVVEESASQLANDCSHKQWQTSRYSSTCKWKSLVLSSVPITTAYIQSKWLCWWCGNQNRFSSSLSDRPKPSEDCKRNTKIWSSLLPVCWRNRLWNANFGNRLAQSSQRLDTLRQFPAD